MNILESLEGLFSSKLNLAKTLISLVKLEARLAGLSVFPLLLTICFLFVLLMTVWLSAMILLMYLISLTLKPPVLAVVLVLLLNIGLLIIAIKYLIFNVRKMSFEKTREYFSHSKRSENHELKKTGN